MRLELTGAAFWVCVAARTAPTVSTVKPWRSPSSRKTRDIAAALVAEGEILAGHDAGHAEIRDEPFGNELLRGQARQRPVEMEHDHRVGARVAEQPLALIERGEAKRRRLGPEKAHRMRVEGRDQRGRVALLRQRHRAPDHRLMPQMKAVEIAKRDHPAAQALADLVIPPDAFHGRRVTGGGRSGKSSPFTGRGTKRSLVEGAGGKRRARGEPPPSALRAATSPLTGRIGRNARAEDPERVAAHDLRDVAVREAAVDQRLRHRRQLARRRTPW